MFLTFSEPQTAPISGAQTSPFPADMAHPARCKQKYPSRGRFSPHSGFQLERPQNHRLQAASRLSDKLTDLISIFQRPELDFSKNKAEGDDIILSLRFRVFHDSLILTQKTTSANPFWDGRCGFFIGRFLQHALALAFVILAHQNCRLTVVSLNSFLITVKPMFLWIYLYNYATITVVYWRRR